MIKYRKFSSKEVETIQMLYKTHLTSEIATILDRTPRAITNQIHKLGLTDRPCDKKITRSRKWNELEKTYSMPIKEILYSLYWIENKSLLEMAEILNVCSRTVDGWLIVLGIQRRSNSEGNNVRYSKMTKQQIDDKFLNAREEHKRICSLVNTENRRYERDSEWLKISEIVKNRDGYKCADCGMSEEESNSIYGNGLCVHHVTPYHICKEHNEDNLISLCTGCHLKIHRRYWWEEVRKQKRLQELKNSREKQFTISQF